MDLVTGSNMIFYAYQKENFCKFAQKQIKNLDFVKFCFLYKFTLTIFNNKIQLKYFGIFYNGFEP